MSVEVQIQLPPIWKCLAERETNPLLVIEHSRLNCRALEVATALAVSSYLEGRKVVLFAPNGKSVFKSFIGRFFPNLKRPISCDNFELFTNQALSFGEFWVSYSLTHSKLPFPLIDDIYIVDAHKLIADPTTLISRYRRKRVLGELADRDHWAYTLGRENDTVRIGMESILTTFPDQVPYILDESDPYYKRAMHVEDVEPNFNSASFFVFARKRIKIVTQKPISLLSERQQAIAKVQFGEPLVPFDTTKLQKRYFAMKALAKKKGKRPWFILVKYRRGGFTTSEQALSYHHINVRPRSQVVTLADSIGKTQRIFRMVKVMHQNDPKAPALVGDSKSRIELENGSVFFIGTAGTKAFARGDTLARFHGSEVAFWCQGAQQEENTRDILAGLFGAAEYGEGVLESTPNGRNFFYQLYQEAKNNQNELTPIFLRWFDDPINQLLEGMYNKTEILDSLSNDEIELINKHGLTVAQIAYRRQKQRESKVLFPQEYPEDDDSCFLVSGLCFFDMSALFEVNKRFSNSEEQDKPIKTREIPGGIEVIWQKPIPGIKYCGGVDTSEGLGPPCDMNGIGIVRRDTGEQVAAIHGRWKPEILALHVSRMSKVYNNALMGVERNNHGHSVLNTLTANEFAIPHYQGGPLFYFRDGRAGWNTDPTTRPQILDTVGEFITVNPTLIHDKQFVAECGTFRLQKNGRWDHDSGCHDDTIFKWGIAWKMREMPIVEPSMDFV